MSLTVTKKAIVYLLKTNKAPIHESALFDHLKEPNQRTDSLAHDAGKKRKRKKKRFRKKKGKEIKRWPHKYFIQRRPHEGNT